MTRFLRSEKGQTSVEYLLLIAVAIGFGILFFRKMDDYLIKNPNGLIGQPLNSYRNSIGNPQEGYKRFPLRY